MCIIKTEKNNFRPSLPCIAHLYSEVPDLDHTAPNCFVGGWQMDEETGTWNLKASLLNFSSKFLIKFHISNLDMSQ